MHTRISSPFPGIEDRELVWSAAERRALARAAAILAEARGIVGPDSDLGTDLGKAEVVLRDYPEGLLIETRTVPLTL